MRTCAEVRELLAEHALGTLPPGERAAVDQHLAWCAGCRKEAAELADGAAAAALAMPPADPPPDLEDRVVAGLAEAGSRRRRPRWSAVAAVVAAAVATATTGWALAMAGRVQDLEEEAAAARSRAERAVEEFREVLAELAGSDEALLSATLGPTEEHPGAGGRAVVYDSPGAEDFVVVVAGGLPSSGEPYRAVLHGPDGPIAVGKLEPSGQGQLARFRMLPEPGGGYTAVVVEDRRGREALRAALTAETG